MAEMKLLTTLIYTLYTVNYYTKEKSNILLAPCQNVHNIQSVVALPNCKRGQ